MSKEVAGQGRESRKSLSDYVALRTSDLGLIGIDESPALGWRDDMIFGDQEICKRSKIRSGFLQQSSSIYPNLPQIGEVSLLSGERYSSRQGLMIGKRAPTRQDLQ